ncbi:16186_t:CDS:2 [Funneliformis geosporum]|uniref:9957_t:CDS:1 n=1 Tax=Funneliformis geosporum TaxID=1117311 RepID=A0A9W4X529_9GLOM|nr:9957_t:CDS:2 [Funneliformis geosporum]CAI2187310.1 16186_t:CDS:2 [Funneliformis geosporum]
MDEINYQRINTKFLNNVIKMEPNFDDKEQVFVQNQEVDFIPCVLKFDDTKLVENIEKIPFSDHNQNCCDQIIDDRPAFAELMKNNSEHENSYIEEDEDELKYFNKDVSDSQMCSIKEEGFEERQDSDDEMTADDYITFYGGQSTSRYHNIHNEGKSILGQKSVKNLAANYKLLPRDEDQEKFFSEVICLTDEESFIVDDEYPTSQRQGFKKIKSHSNSQSTPIYQLQTEDEFIMIVEQKQQEDDDVIFINPTTGKEEPWTPNSKKATSIFSTTSPESHTLTEVEESTNKNVSNQTRIPLAIARNVTPWTPEEDRKLIEGVLTQLSPSWIQISRNYELNRSGDSCRQRWARLKKRLYGSA